VVTVPVIGKVVDVDIYVCIGCGNEVIETLPEMGSVVDVETYTFQGVVACVTPMGAFVTLTGKVVLVETYVTQGTVPWYVVTALIETETGS
jgi:hypothetical protein